MPEATPALEPKERTAIAEATHIDSVEAPPITAKFVKPSKYVSYHFIALHNIR